MSYSLLKTAHVLGVVAFVGNILVTAIWKLRADATRDPRIVAFGQRLVTLTDRIFTAPGAMLVLITGMLMIEPLGLRLREITWLARGLDLFLTSALIWLVVLLPIQRKQTRLARSFEAEQQLPDQYYKLGRWWLVAGLVATLLPLVNVYLMVAKPQ